MAAPKKIDESGDWLLVSKSLGQGGVETRCVGGHGSSKHVVEVTNYRIYDVVVECSARVLDQQSLHFRKGKKHVAEWEISRNEEGARVEPRETKTFFMTVETKQGAPVEQVETVLAIFKTAASAFPEYEATLKICMEF